MAFCRECGTELSDTMRFCPKCGTENALATAGNVPVKSTSATVISLPESPDTPTTAPSAPTATVIVAPEESGTPAAAQAPAVNGPSHDTAEAVSEADMTQQTPSNAPLDAQPYDAAPAEGEGTVSASLAALVTGKPAPTPTTAPPQAPTQTPPPAPPADAAAPQPKKRRWLPWAIVALVVILLVAVGLAVFFWWQGDQKAHESHAVAFEVQIADYDPSQSTKIPVHITGADLDQKSVDTTTFVTTDQTAINLIQGDYMLAFPASPLSASGTFWKAPTAVYHIVVNDQMENGYSVDMQGSVASFEVLEPLNITDEEITTAFDTAILDESQKDAAATYRDTTTKLRDEAVAAEQQRQEEERQAREAAAARAAALHVETSLYAFDLPDSWYGLVNITREGNEVTISYKNDPSYDLITTSIEPSTSGPPMGGDIGSGIFYYADLGNGQQVIFFVRRYTADLFAAHLRGGLPHSEADARQIIAMESGGQLSLSQAQTDSGAGPVIDDYLAAVIGPTVQVF